MKSIILAGGTGTGLWPVSRIYNPKQFVKLKNRSESFFQRTVKNCVDIMDSEDIFIVTNSEYKYFVTGQLEEIGIHIPESNVILEPSFKNTLHAVSMGVCKIMDVSGGHVRDVLVIPSNGAASDYSAIFNHSDVFSCNSVPYRIC